MSGYVLDVVAIISVSCVASFFIGVAYGHARARHRLRVLLRGKARTMSIEANAAMKDAAEEL